MKPRANGTRYVLIHPLLIFISVWLLCFLLYAMHLSKLLVFTTAEVGSVVCWIIAPFIVGYFIVHIFYAVSPTSKHHIKAISNDEYLKRVEDKLDWWFRCWLVLSVIEIAFSGGFPLEWLIIGGSKNRTEFGLPIIHVFMVTLLSVLALTKFGLYLLHGDKRRLYIPFFQIIWSVVVISRSMMIVALVQSIVLLICIKGVTIKMVRWLSVVSLVTIVVFGTVGDLRQGDDSYFRDLAMPSANYPDWLPSGVLWAYIYVTTPVGNLVNTSNLSKPSYNIRFPNTIYTMFPTFIRIALYGKDPGLGMGGDLVYGPFNVSTAYVGPFMDYGYIGITCFSLLIGIISSYFWRKRRQFKYQLLYSVMVQCLALSIFWNFLFDTSFLGQFIWIFLLFRQKTFRVFPARAVSPVPCPQKSLPIEAGDLS
jgi:oligosaccharide repeat unit polymerase